MFLLIKSPPGGEALKHRPPRGMVSYYEIGLITFIEYPQREIPSVRFADNGCPLYPITVTSPVQEARKASIMDWVETLSE